MKQSRSIGKEPNLPRVVLVSAILHLLFISLVVIPLKTKEKEFISYYVTLVEPIRLPSPDEAPLAEKKEKEITTVKVPPKADISLEDFERVTKEIKRLQAISDLKKRKKTGEVQIGKKKTPDKVTPDTGIPGRKAGGDTNSYYSIISREIWQQWVYPDIKASGLEVIISIKIDRDGKVVLQEIEKSSGNLLFDRSAMKAISKASPFPPPPVEMEIGVRFYL